MPIRKELRYLYRGPQWEDLRAEVLERANHRCEHCARPNREFALATRDGSGRWNKAAANLLWERRDRLELEVTRGACLLVADLQELPFLVSSWRKWHSPGKRPPFGADAPGAGLVWLVKTSITVAHLDFNAENMALSNLGALCQRCHLQHDAKQHYAEARRTIAARTGQLWLSNEIENATRPPALTISA